MGGGTFDSSAYASFASTTRGKTVDEVFDKREMSKALDPKGVLVRESRDSDDHPNSTPVIVALDVTGSMGMLANTIAREGLGVLINSILDRKPIVDPHVMFMAIGDANCDRAPLQVSQFEADNRIVEQLTQIWVEHGGGGNKFESYNLPWYFAAHHTVHDSMVKRSKRGYLFTVGDEEAPQDLTPAQIKQFIGDTVQDPATLSTRLLLEQAQRAYDVYHVIIEEGSHFQHSPNAVLKSWNELLGQHVIRLSDHRLLAETIVSTIEIAEGRSVDTATSHWGGHKSTTVLGAVKNLPGGKPTRKLLGA